MPRRRTKTKCSCVLGVCDGELPQQGHPRVAHPVRMLHKHQVAAQTRTDTGGSGKAVWEQEWATGEDVGWTQGIEYGRQGKG